MSRGEFAPRFCYFFTMIILNMKKTSLDTYDILPKDMMAYLRHNGWHFNKKACEYAVSMMRDRDGNRAKMLTRQEVDEMMAQYGINIKDTNNYDYVYIANMCKNDYLGRSVIDDNRMMLYVKDTVEDPDAAEGQTFRRWYSDMCGKGEMIFWEEII